MYPSSTIRGIIVVFLSAYVNILQRKLTSSYSVLSNVNLSLLIKVIYKDMNEALDSVRHGETWGVIGIGQNFTQDLYQRYVQKY